MKRFLIPLSLIIFIAIAVGINLQLTSAPMIRTNPQNPVYTLGSKDEASDLSHGKQVIKLGPCLFGLYPGAIAFRSVQQAKDFIGLKGYDADKWIIFQLSGDYQLDVTNGVLNKTLSLSQQINSSASDK